MQREILTEEEDKMFVDLVEPMRRFFKRKGLSYSYSIIAVGYYLAWCIAVQPDPDAAFNDFTKATRLQMKHFRKHIANLGEL